MTEEELKKEMLRVAEAIAKTKSPKLTADYGKHMTKIVKELTALRGNAGGKKNKQQ